MKSFVIQAWEATRNSDMTEGRGHSVTIAYFSKRGDAERAARGASTMGSDGEVRAVNHTVRIYDSYEEFTGQQRTDTRLRALAKLTAEEMEALGLKGDRP